MVENAKIFQKLEQLHICHLCLVKNDKFIDLFSEQTLENNLRNKLSELFHIEISKQYFPWLICLECSEKIEMFSLFYGKVHETQKTLMSLYDELKIGLETDDSILTQEIQLENIKELGLLKVEEHDQQQAIIPFDPLDCLNSIIDEVIPIESVIIKSENDCIKSENDEEYLFVSDDDIPLIKRASIVPRTKRKKNDQLESDESKIINQKQNDNEEDEDDGDICDLSKINESVSNNIRKTKRPVTTESKESQSKNNFCKINKKNDLNNDNEDNENDDDDDDESPRLTHRIKLDGPIREFFDLKCLKCNKLFLTFTTMKKHMEKIHNQQCFVTCCNRKLYRREAIMEHISYHLNPKQFVCPQCDQNCKSKITLKIHMKQHLPIEERPFHCDKCNQGFVLKSQLQSHEKSHYTDEQKKFVCEECGKAFAFKFVLEKHKLHIHIRDKNFMCEICARSFVDKVNLTAHKRTHDINIPRLQCPFCEARLKNKVTLKIHMRVHNPSVHTCNLCNKILATKNALMNHIQYVHSEKKHKCNVCDKTFKKALTLKEHTSIHTGEVLYKCQHCTKNFNAKANMYSHIKKMHYTEWAEAKKLKWLNGS